jgi:probable rRNA maturation factor
MKKSSITIDLQNDSGITGIPSIEQIECWVVESLQSDYAQLEQTIRVVDEAESRQLNKTYRDRDKPTNVLSFPAENSQYLDYDHLGDLVICATVLVAEAEQQNKSLQSHWAHIIVHGMLHLQGYDHLDDEEARQMEALEIEILAALGHTNPYQI